MIAIYPGSFDPFHDGHLNILEKSTKLFEKVYLVVTKNVNKTPKEPIEVRLQKIKEVVQNFNNVEVIINDNELTTDVASKLGANYIIRGLRSQNDFKHELEYYDGFKSLNHEIEVVYFISDLEKRKISSTILKEIAQYQK